MPTLKTAWLEFEGVCWRAQSDEVTQEAKRGAWASPLIHLIHGIYQAEPRFALKILRTRIYTDYPLELWEKETVRVVAKRVTDGVSAPYSVHPVGAIRELLGMSAESALESAAVEEESVRDRPVFASLHDLSGNELLASRNRNGVNRLRHAEVLLVLDVLSKLRDGLIHKSDIEGSTVRVSLQPCRMCAAWMYRWLKPLGVDGIVYRDPDPGPLSKAPWLTELGLAGHWIRQEEVE